MAGDSKNGGPICSSCYNGFFPIVKHLQSLTANGHAFQEPCIQQLFASCWNEEMSYCPDSKTNVRRLKSQSIPNSCDCEKMLEKGSQKVKHLNERVVRKFNKRKSAVKSSGRGSKGETLRRLYRMVKRLQSKVMRLDGLQNDPKYVANEVSVKRSPSDTPIGVNGGIFNQCNKLRVVDPMKLSASERQDKIFGNLKEASLGTELTLGPIGTAGNLMRCKLQSQDPMKLSPTTTNIEGSDNLKAEANLGTELVLGSIWTNVEHCKVDFLEPVDFTLNKANTKGSNKLKEESNSMYNELALGSINTLLGDIRGISNSHDKSQSTDPVNLSPSKRNINRKDTSGTELSLIPAGNCVEQCNIRGNIGIFNRSSEFQPAEPLKSSPSIRNSKKSDSFTAEAIPSTIGQCMVDLGKKWKKREFENTWIFESSKRNKKGSDTLNAGATLESGPSTADQCSDSDDLYSIERCMAIINEMKNLDPFVYSAAQDLFENLNWRKIFVSLKREKRLIWLISMLPGV